MTKFLLPPNDHRRWRAGSEPHRIARVMTPCPRQAVTEAPLSEAQRAALEASQAVAASVGTLPSIAAPTRRAVPKARGPIAAIAGFQMWGCP